MRCCAGDRPRPRVLPPAPRQAAAASDRREGISSAAGTFARPGSVRAATSRRTDGGTSTKRRSGGGEGGPPVRGGGRPRDRRRPGPRRPDSRRWRSRREARTAPGLRPPPDAGDSAGRRRSAVHRPARPTATGRLRPPRRIPTRRGPGKVRRNEADEALGEKGCHQQVVLLAVVRGRVGRDVAEWDVTEGERTSQSPERSNCHRARRFAPPTGPASPGSPPASGRSRRERSSPEGKETIRIRLDTALVAVSPVPSADGRGADLAAIREPATRCGLLGLPRHLGRVDTVGRRRLRPREVRGSHVDAPPVRHGVPDGKRVGGGRADAGLRRPVRRQGPVRLHAGTRRASGLLGAAVRHRPGLPALREAWRCPSGSGRRFVEEIGVAGGPRRPHRLSA